MTFLQLSFVSLYSLPHFVHWYPNASYLFYLPRIHRPVVPLRTWALQVLALLGMNVFNNWSFAYRIPLTLQIVFRSSGRDSAFSSRYSRYLPLCDLCRLVTNNPWHRPRCLNAIWIFISRQTVYKTADCKPAAFLPLIANLLLIINFVQAAVFLVTLGVTLATISRPSTSSSSDPVQDNLTYIKGISVMTLSLLLSGVLGTLQEKTYRRYGRVWREGVFYTVSMPV